MPIRLAKWLLTKPTTWQNTDMGMETLAGNTLSLNRVQVMSIIMEEGRLMVEGVVLASDMEEVGAMVDFHHPRKGIINLPHSKGMRLHHLKEDIISPNKVTNQNMEPLSRDIMEIKRDIIRLLLEFVIL